MKKELETKIIKWWPFLFVLTAVLFNLWLLSPEVAIKSDPNDNIFQFGLVDRMDRVWQRVLKKEVGLLSLVDHWVPNWAEGYPLPFYYSHLPHLGLVIGYRLLGPVLSFLVPRFSLFTFFHLLQFLLLSLTPLSFYFGSRLLGFSGLTAGLTALFSSQILTDGLYGIDVSSYAWRGYGLSLQALSVFFLPLVLGATWRAIKLRRKYPAAVLWLTVCLASHIATGYIGLLSCALIPLAMIKLPFQNYRREIGNLVRKYLSLLIIFGIVFMVLAYWFVPLIFYNQYHAVSFWDPPSKWFSYGFREVINLFLKGELFDFGRLPFLTGLAIVGFFVAAYRSQKPRYRFLSLLFPFWFVLFFGQPTFGRLIYLLPMTREYHLHRFIIGVHLAGIFLVGLGSSWLFQKLMKLKIDVSVNSVKSIKPVKPILAVLLTALIILPVYRQTYRYLKPNQDWLKGANRQFEQDWPDFERIIQELAKRPPGRIYAGRPGNWGRDFKLGTTSVYMALSVRGWETIGFLPETWSLNSDSEQFFNEQRPEHFDLYNVRYLVSPPDYQAPDFAREILTSGKYRLYSIETSGYFSLGFSDLTLQSQKENILNPIHAWLASDWVGAKQFPALVFEGQPENPNFIKMLDEINYRYQGQNFHLFDQYPFGPNQPFNKNPQGKIVKEEVGFQKYTGTVEIDKECQNCLVVFKMTYHPNWVAKIDNLPVRKMMVFPSYMAVEGSGGTHSIQFEYRPHKMKLPLIVFGLSVLGGLGVLKYTGKKRQK